MSGLKELLKVLAVVFAAWVVFLLTAPEGYAAELEVPVVEAPTQGEFNYQARMVTKAAASCQEWAMDRYAEIYGEEYNPGGFRNIAQACVDARTAPFINQLNAWGDSLPEADMKRLAEGWDKARDAFIVEHR